MGKNVSDKRTQNITVQDELYSEMLSGFTTPDELTSKKSVQPSTIQKVRLQMVAKHFLTSQNTNYFTKTWVQSLSNTIDVDAIRDRLAKVIEVQEGIDEGDEEELEEDEEEKKSPFDIFTLFKVYRAISTVKTIVDLWKKVDNFADKNAQLSKDLQKLDDGGAFKNDLKRAFLLRMFQDKIVEVLNPVMLKVQVSMFKFYDEKLIPKIATIIDKFKEEGKKLIAETATSMIPVVGPLFCLVNDLGGGINAVMKGNTVEAAAYFTSAGISAVQFTADAAAAAATVGTLGVAAPSFALSTGAKVALSAVKMGAKGVILHEKIKQAMYFDLDEQRKLAKEVIEMRNEHLAPIAQKIDEKIDNLSEQISTMEKKTYDYVYDKFDVKKQVQEAKMQALQQANVVGRLVQGTMGITDKPVQFREYKSNKMTFYKIGDSEFGDFLKSQDGLAEEMRRSISKRYNIYVDDSDLKKLAEENTGLIGLWEVRVINDQIIEYFSKIYSVFFAYADKIFGCYQGVIEKIVSGEDEKKKDVLIGQFKFSDLISLDWWVQKTELKIKEKRGDVVSLVNSSPAPRPKQEDQNTKTEEPKTRLWVLSKKTLRPFVPFFEDNYIKGFEVVLQNVNGAEKNYKVEDLTENLQTNKMVNDTLEMLQNVDFSFSDIRKGISSLNRMFLEMSQNYDTYKKTFELFESKKVNYGQGKSAKKIYYPEYERILEGEINEQVTRIYNEVMAKIA